MIALHVARFMSFGVPLMWNLIDVRVQVGQPIDARARFLRRLADGVEPRRVQPRAIETGAILLLHQLESLELVGLRRAEADGARHAVRRRTSSAGESGRRARAASQPRSTLRCA